MFRIWLSLSLGLLAFLPAMAQGPSRSGFPADLEDKTTLRRFPCGGQAQLDEDFQGSALPSGWAVLDEDGFLPRQEILFLTPIGGWQQVVDFKDADSSNLLLASPSWYTSDSSPSNDFLILPATTLPAQPCLSWYAYSQDKLFPESYEIRVSTTNPDAAGFLANPPVLTISAEGDEFTYRSTSLAAYAGQTVFIAFRQTTEDGFILALDDIRIANVEGTDLAMFNVNGLQGDPLDTLFFSGSVINLGLDTLVFDTAQMSISWQINNETVQTITIPEAFTLLPNDTIQFAHDSAWVPLVSASYRLRVWVSGIGVDDNIENDTLSRFQAIGTATGLLEPEALSLGIFPNPSDGTFQVNIPAGMQAGSQLVIFDSAGRRVQPEILRKEADRWVVSGLMPGLYLVTLTDIKQKRATGKVLLSF